MNGNDPDDFDDFDDPEDETLEEKVQALEDMVVDQSKEIELLKRWITRLEARTRGITSEEAYHEMVYDHHHETDDAFWDK